MTPVAVCGSYIPYIKHGGLAWHPWKPGMWSSWQQMLRCFGKKKKESKAWGNNNGVGVINMPSAALRETTSSKTTGWLKWRTNWAAHDRQILGMELEMFTLAYVQVFPPKYFKIDPNDNDIYLTCDPNTNDTLL